MQQERLVQQEPPGWQVPQEQREQQEQSAVSQEVVAEDSYHDHAHGG